MIKEFWRWYQKNYLLNISIAAGLFLVQIVHLFWLASDVLALKLLGAPIIEFSGLLETILIFIDYTEIPAIITTSLVYINEIRQKTNLKSWLYLFFINSQWLHLFWITDEFVVNSFGGTQTVLPFWLAIVAILIDYLELPVIYDTLKKLKIALGERNIEKTKEAFAE